MKKRILSVILAAVMIPCMSACSGTGTESVTSTTNADSESDSENAVTFTPSMDTEEEATVNIVGPLENFEALEAVISDFEEIYPNCQVLYTYLGEADLEARLASDDTVGIFMTKTNVYQSDNYLAEYCANLLDEDIDLGAVRQTALDSVTIDGVLYGLPIAQNTNGLIVNETILENEGLSVPTNYSEFLSVCETLKEKGYTPIQGFDSWDNGYSYVYKILIQNMFKFMLEDEIDEDDDLSTLLAGEEGSAEFLQGVFDRLGDLVEEGYIDPEVNKQYADNYDSSILKFFEGDVPFLVATTETYSGTKKRETKSEYYSENPFDYSFITAPLADDGAYTYMETWLSFCVNDKCVDKEWAMEFMRFLATNDELDQLASIKGLPTVTYDSVDERYANLYPEDEALLKYGSLVIPTTIEDAVADVTMEIVYDDSVDTANASAEMERIIREGDTETEEEEAAE